MDEQVKRERIGAQIVVVGFLIVAIAAALTWAQCTLFSDLPLGRNVAWRQAFCPATVPSDAIPTGPWRLVVSKLFALWLLGFSAILGGAIRLVLERRPTTPASVPSANEPTATTPLFGKRTKPLAPVMLPETFELSRDALRGLELAIKEACAGGDLITAQVRLSETVAKSGDLELQAIVVAGSKIDLDWPRIAAEAIDAERRARKFGLPPCNYIEIELGNTTETRTTFNREFSHDAPAGRRSIAWRWAHIEPMNLSGIDYFAALKFASQMGGNQTARETTRTLVTHALVLGFFAAVNRRAEADGLPFAANVCASIRDMSGPERIYELGPAISFVCSAHAAAPNAEVVAAAEALHAREALQYSQDTARLLDSVRQGYARAGYIRTRGLPESLGETLVRLRAIEDRLIQDQLGWTIKSAEFLEIVERVRALREAEAPKPYDLAAYR